MEGMTRWRRITLAAVVLAVVVAACGDDESADPATTAGANVQDDARTESTDADRVGSDPTNLPDRVPADGAGPTVTGEVPEELLNLVIEDAAMLAGVDPADTSVVTAQEMLWADGSLDCPEPGGVYTQAPVPGYWVVIQAGSEGYGYRLTSNGSFTLCTSRFTGPGGSAPTS